MAHAGLETRNPITGLRTIFHRTAADTDGDLLRVEWIAPAGWSAGPKHVHPNQEERFEVLSGRIRSHVDGREQLHGPGEVVVAPAGAVHTVSEERGKPVRLMVDFRPALRSEDVLETLAALAVAGGLKADGAPSNLLDLALIVHDFEPEIYMAKPPLAIQRALFGPLAALGRMLGRSSVHRYPEVAAADGAAEQEEEPSPAPAALG